MTNKRKLFDELMEGVDAMRREREGEIALRSHEVENRSLLVPWKTGSRDGPGLTPRLLP